MYIKYMIDYDVNKNEANISNHGISLEDAAAFDFDTAIQRVDDRYDYGETRYISIGYIDERLHVFVWTVRNECIRAISLRKANKRERDLYEHHTA